jgi:2-polyprenyl-3-methyl-5-hydroxy-6-metoxy-1,4-benzoquinol methylase
VIDSLGGELESYTIVEGSPLSIESFRASLQPPPNGTLEHALFEQFEARRLYDAIEMGFVLEHVDDPRLVVERFRAFLRPGGTLVVVVPNALSLHRRLGHAAGLLADPYRLSPQDLELGHRRYFDRASLESLLRAAGLRIERCEGVFLKPLTTDQLRRLQLPPDVVRAFMSVGVEHPDLCNAVYVEAAT